MLSNLTFVSYKVKAFLWALIKMIEPQKERNI